MLHQSPKNFVPAATTTPAIAAATPDELKRARAWIAGARRCGLVVVPWKGSTDPSDKGGVLMHGEDEDGRNDFTAASDRFREHPAFGYRDDLPVGLVYELLCQDYGVEHSDPAFCDKVNSKVRAEMVERKLAEAERKLLRLCRSADHILKEDARLEAALSNIDDAFGDVEKPARPADGMLPSSYGNMSFGEAREQLRQARTTPKDKLDYWKVAALATGRFKAFVDALKVYETRMHALEDEHGLTAARKAADTASRRSRTIIAEIAAIPATSPSGLAAKCRVMKVCRETGWGLHDVFEDLATSIFDEGAHCGEMLLPTYRPRRSEPTTHVHH